MKNNKVIISNKFDLFFFGFTTIFLILFTPFTSVSMFINAISLNNLGYILLVSFETLSFLCLAYLSLTMLNRSACKIWFEDGNFHRKGLLYGFRKTVPLSDIQKLTLATYYRLGRYIVIVDDKSTSDEFLSKNGYLGITDTEENRAWIESVSKLEIENKY